MVLKEDAKPLISSGCDKGLNSFSLVIPSPPFYFFFFFLLLLLLNLLLLFSYLPQSSSFFLLIYHIFPNLFLFSLSLNSVFPFLLLQTKNHLKSMKFWATKRDLKQEPCISFNSKPNLKNKVFLLIYIQVTNLIHD